MEESGESVSISDRESGVAVINAEVLVEDKALLKSTMSTEAMSSFETGTEDRLSAKCPPSHMLNSEAHPAFLRIGIPIFLLGTFALLLACDMGSGVSADLQQSVDGEVLSYGTILTVSVFSSVKELWHAESYSLALIIIVTSISWPYLKLALSFYAWTAPFKNRRESDVNVILAKREKMLFWLDVLGKWSFVDVYVLITIMVVFRSTVDQGFIVTDVWILPKWGFFGFVLASILSIFGTHVILSRHRRVQDKLKEDFGTMAQQQNGEDVFQEDGPPASTADDGISQQWEGKKSLASLSKTPPLKILLPLIIAIILKLIGAFVKCFTFTYSGMMNFTKQHSFISIGIEIPDSYTDPDNILIRLVQIFYYALGIVLPVYACVMLAVLFLWPFSSIRGMRRVFVLSEIAFAWSSCDVYVLSAVASVSQSFKFSTGILDTGCATCFEVGATIEPTLAWSFVGAVANLAVGFWLLNKAHGTMFGSGSTSMQCCSFRTLSR